MRQSFAFAIILFAAAAARAQDSFAGTWETTFGKMKLTQEGDKVTGFYEMEGRRCSIEGKLEKKRFSFHYQEPSARGEGFFDLSADGRSFTGKWRQNGEGEFSDWTGTRTNVSAAAKNDRFTGLWETSFGRMRLVQSGNKVVGTYSFNGGSGIEGTVEGNKLTLQYKEPAGVGTATFELSSDGSRFAGKWKLKDSSSGGEWTGERVEPRVGVIWLVVIEAHWESSLTDDEYSFGGMLRAFFSRSSSVQVRHRFYTDEASLKRWCADVAYIAEPTVVVIASHGSSEGVAVDGKTVPATAFAESLRMANNVKLLHFSACQIMKGRAAETIAQGVDPSSRFPISGYTTSVDWAGSAVIEFAYLDMILMRGMTPSKAAEQLLKMMPFAGNNAVRGSAFGNAGFRLLKPEDVK